MNRFKKKKEKKKRRKKKERKQVLLDHHVGHHDVDEAIEAIVGEGQEVET